MSVDYKTLYFHLAGKVSDAIDLIDLSGDPPETALGRVREQLIRAIRAAEEEYLEQGE